MEILYFSLSKLRNEEHFQFHTEFRDLIIEATPVALGIEPQYSGYNLFYANEAEALAFVAKNDITNELYDGDFKRDDTYRGLSATIKAGSYHYNPVIKQATAHVLPLFDQYGNIAAKSFTQETAAINNMVSKLNLDYAADVTTIGIAGWLNELQANNTAFDTLFKSRNSTEAEKTQLRMKRVRLEVDAAYRQITYRINAAIIMNGEAAYKVFVDALNQWIEMFGNNVAIRTGQNAKVIKPPVVKP